MHAEAIELNSDCFIIAVGLGLIRPLPIIQNASVIGTAEFRAISFIHPNFTYSPPYTKI